MAEGAAPVVFFVVSGPDSGTGAGATTDSAGHASFVVHGVAAGTDVVRAYAADGSALVASNDASVAWTSVSTGAVTVTGTSNPIIITSGSAAQVHFTIANPGPGTANGVIAGVDVPIGVTPTSAKITQGGCGAFVGRHAVCLIGAIAPADAASGTATVGGRTRSAGRARRSDHAEVFEAIGGFGPVGGRIG